MRAFAIAVLLIAGVAAHAGADETTTQARQHYERATSLYDVGRFGEAAQEYEAAYQIKNDPALLFNLGQAYRYAGEYDKAIFAYRGYLRRVPDADNRSEVEGYIARSQRLLDEKKAAAKAVAKVAVPPMPQRDAPTPAAASQAGPLAAVAARPRPPTPVYKRWWLWTTVGAVAVAGAGVGLYFALTTPSGTRATPVFPAVGGP